ncbi:hypothetical protein F2Q68_00015545 [Brassica cretica]|uniref:Uncharacterized protein n=1 Tax=Brassica cretica TaxID=69181 RepID=A0A8S9HRQ2_BRACR|nr:hypothetical protein F2Q68_00015545 [Brassica cretica]
MRKTQRSEAGLTDMGHLLEKDHHSRHFEENHLATKSLQLQDPQTELEHTIDAQEKITTATRESPLIEHPIIM